MLNNKLARQVIGTIIGKTVVYLKLEQQEIVVRSEQLGFDVFHLDFKATIQQEDGRQEQVLIELQKARNPGDIDRFRRYIGSTYMHTNTPVNIDIQVTEQPVPIVLIYLLGFNLSEIEALAVRIENKVVNLSTQAVMDVECSFVDAVVHSCYIMQVKRLPKEPVTMMEQFLSLFDQSNVVPGKRYILEIEDSKIPKAFLDMVKYLQKPLKDQVYERKLQLEQDLEELLLFREKQMEYAKAKLEQVAQEVEEAVRQKDEVVRQKDEAVREKDQAILEKDEVVRQKEEATRQKEEATRQKEEERRQKEALLKASVLALQQHGLDNLTIAGILGVSIDDIEAVL